jgi:hypothetical protein
MVRKNVIVIMMVVVVACATVYAGKAEKAGKHEGKIELPKVVKSAIKGLYPAGIIKKTKTDKEYLKLYEVKLDANGVEVEIKAAADGTVAEVETKENVESLPAAVAHTATAKGGKVIEAGKKVIHSQLKLVKLDTPVTKYEVNIKKDVKITKLQIDADGKILKEKTEKGKKEKKGEKEHHKGNDDNKD